MLAVLDGHVLKHVGHILAVIDGGLEEFVDFLQLDQRDGVLFLLEQIGYGSASNPIGLDGVRTTAGAPPPLLGEHAGEILAEAGYPSHEVERMLAGVCRI